LSKGRFIRLLRSAANQQPLEWWSANDEVWERIKTSHFQQNFKLIIFYTTKENIRKMWERVHVQAYPCPLGITVGQSLFLEVEGINQPATFLLIYCFLHFQNLLYKHSKVEHFLQKDMISHGRKSIQNMTMAT